MGLVKASQCLDLASKGLAGAFLGLARASLGLALAFQVLAWTSQGLYWASQSLARASLGLAWASLGLAQASGGVGRRMDEWTDRWNFSPFYMTSSPATLWVEFTHIDACGLVSSTPPSYSQTSLQAEWHAVERS